MAYWSSVPGAAWCSIELGSAYKESAGGGGVFLNFTSQLISDNHLIDLKKSKLTL